MRSIIITLGALLGLLFAWPSFAQTALHCSTAVDALKASNEAATELRLSGTYDRIDAVNRILVNTGWESYVGFADTIQIFYITPNRYMLMASVQGCHVDHVFIDETVVAKLKQTFDITQTKPSGAEAPA